MTWEPYFQTWLKEIWKSDSSRPKIHFKKNKGTSESYSLTYAGKVLTLEAESLTSAFHGVSLASMAAGSGQIAEFLGEHIPKFPLRPLWIQQEACPSFEEKASKAEKISRQLLLLGFNAIVLEWDKTQTKTIGKFINKLKGFGLKVILRPGKLIEESPLSHDPDYLEPILEELTPFLTSQDFLFWESTIYSQNSERERDFLRSDLAKREIVSLERRLSGKCRLIYYVPTPNSKEALKECSFLSECFLSSHSDTLFAFSSNAGGPSEHLLPPHPLWESLRTSRQNSHWRLLPLINAGHIGQGEGFWPLLPLKTIERSLALCRTPQFLGACILTSHLPKESSLLSCSLWITGHSLIGLGSPRNLAETWIRAMHPDFQEFPECTEIMEECGILAARIGGLSKQLKKISQGAPKEEFKLLAESVLSRIKYLQCKLANYDSSNKRSTFCDRFQLFASDAKKIIFFLLTQAQLPIVNVLNETDMEESFWTDLASGGPFGNSRSPKVSLREKPNTGKPGSLLSAIYDEVISL